jgi:ribosomal protein L37E
MFCRYCGRKLNNSEKKCDACGAERESLTRCNGGALQQILTESLSGEKRDEDNAK